eukprot:CAMPEP_0198678786 /NCGR_PEP_ID=MMETSP1468-20131203/1495_1 /TAXON_ID=1461545 /ORGANISM="Mantoniella sp, Strain CCMP1436" /LENGTH=49 /DNA_ID= /DNA_START= /DNA_END= /DNA_ORIENTATION=
MNPDTKNLLSKPSILTPESHGKLNRLNLARFLFGRASRVSVGPEMKERR